MFKYKSILISFLFFQCLIAHGQRVPQIRVPNSTLPDIASTFDLLDIIVESLKMEGTIKLSSTLFSIQSQINQDLSLYGACRPYRIHLFLNGYILSDVYLESSPIEKEFVFGKTKIHYTSKNDLTFIAKQETNILTGIIKISSKDNCNIPKTNLTKYTELCEHANNKFSQVSNILWNLGNQNGVQSLQSEILNQVMTLDSISDSTANLNHELDLCETKKVQLKEKIEKLTEQTLKLNESKSNFSESLKKYEDAIQKTLVKIKNEQKKHREKEEFYNSLCEVNKCNCPELHGTSCHHNVFGGYTCEEWKQQIPCEDDFECQKLKELDLIKQSIKIYKGKKENYNVKIDTLRNRISRVQKKIEKNEEKKKMYSVKYKSLNCDSINDIITELDLSKEPLIEKVKFSMNDFLKTNTQFSIHNYRFEILLELEQEIYQALAESNNEKSQKLHSEYLNMLGTLRSNPFYASIFQQIKFLDPVTLWKK